MWELSPIASLEHKNRFRNNRLCVICGCRSSRELTNLSGHGEKTVIMCNIIIYYYYAFNVVCIQDLETLCDHVRDIIG